MVTGRTQAEVDDGTAVRGWEKTGCTRTRDRKKIDGTGMGLDGTTIIMVVWKWDWTVPREQWRYGNGTGRYHENNGSMEMGLDDTTRIMAVWKWGWRGHDTNGGMK